MCLKRVSGKVKKELSTVGPRLAKKVFGMRSPNLQGNAQVEKRCMFMRMYYGPNYYVAGRGIMFYHVSGYVHVVSIFQIRCYLG